MIHWSHEINIGQVLTAITMVVSVFVAYSKFAARLAQHELKLETLWNEFIERHNQ